MKKNYDFTELSNKFNLSMDEAMAYFRIGERRLRAMMDDNPDAEWILHVGNRRYIKRPMFESYLRTARQI